MVGPTAHVTRYINRPFADTDDADVFPALTRAAAHRVGNCPRQRQVPVCLGTKRSRALGKCHPGCRMKKLRGASLEYSIMLQEQVDELSGVAGQMAHS